MTEHPKFFEPASDFTIRVAAPTGQISQAFMQGMANRMATSFHKYGHVNDNFPDQMDACAMIIDRLNQYNATGNTEWLMDVANYAMIEYMLPRHTAAHFRATSADESPGRIDRRGRRVDVGADSKPAG